MKSQSKDRKSIDSYLANVIKESMRATLQRRALQEKENQDLFSSDADEEENKKEPSSSSGGSSTSKETTPDEKKKLSKGDVTSKDVIEKLNTIRAGKSFKDDAISASLEKYVNELDKAERTALFAFLKGISQIVTGEVPEEDVVEPSESPSLVKMKKGSDVKKFTIKPVLVKKPTKDEGDKEKKKPEEDTSGPMPITPKTKK